VSQRRAPHAIPGLGHEGGSPRPPPGGAPLSAPYSEHQRLVDDPHDPARSYDWNEPITQDNWRKLDDLIRERADDGVWARSLLKRSNIRRACAPSTPGGARERATTSCNTRSSGACSCAPNGGNMTRPSMTWSAPGGARRVPGSHRRRRPPAKSPHQSARSKTSTPPFSITSTSFRMIRSFPPPWGSRPTLITPCLPTM